MPDDCMLPSFETCYLFAALGLAHVLASVLGRFTPILRVSVKNTRLSDDGYGQHSFVTKASLLIDLKP